MYVEVLLVRLLILGGGILGAYIMTRYFVMPVITYFWQPYQIVLDAERKKKIAKAKLEATRLEIEATKTWEQCGKEVDNLLEEETSHRKEQLK